MERTDAVREVYFRGKIPPGEAVLKFTGNETVSKLRGMRRKARGVYHVMLINLELRRLGALVD